MQVKGWNLPRWVSKGRENEVKVGRKIGKLKVITDGSWRVVWWWVVGVMQNMTW